MALKIKGPISSIEIVSQSLHDVSRINAVSIRYKEERNESKAPTFALT